MRLFENYKFSDKKHGALGMMSVNLGIIALVGSALATVMPYILKSPSVDRYAFAMVLSVFMALVGMILAIVDKISKGAYDFFPKLGIIINLVVLIFSFSIIYIGTIK